MQLKSGVYSDCLQPGALTSCIWDGPQAGCEEEDLQDFNIKLYSYCDGTWKVLFTNPPFSYWSDVSMSGPYGTYLFTAEPSIVVTISARDAEPCESTTACVSYVKQGEAWDVVRACVPTCALPQNYQSGWTEPGFGDWDFDCYVVTMGCNPCDWDAPWVPYKDSMCVRVTGPEPFGTDTYVLWCCGLWPDRDIYDPSCNEYGRAAVWVTGHGDNMVLRVGWDGVWDFTFFGGSPGVPGGSGTEPWGTYTDGGWSAEVFNCGPH